MRGLRDAVRYRRPLHVRCCRRIGHGHVYNDRRRPSLRQRRNSVMVVRPWREPSWRALPWDLIPAPLQPGNR